MNKLTDYVISLTHLYGLIHKDKVVEIYNMQNAEKITVEAVDVILSNSPLELEENFIVVHQDYFVHESIMEFGEFYKEREQRRGKPFYIPPKEELLRYKDDHYYEITKEYRDLLKFVTMHLLKGDDDRAENLVKEIQGYCEYDFTPGAIFELFNDCDIVFDNDNQVNEVLQLVMNLANNTRIWENNGHTPNEMFELKEKPNLRPLPRDPFKMEPVHSEKIGRNDPCPCGSGRKYKKCCLGKDEIN